MKSRVAQKSLGKGLTFEKVLYMFQETGRIMKENSLETERRIQELERTIDKTNKRIGGLGNSWGDFLEGLAKPGLLDYFSKKGIEVHNTHSNYKEYRDEKTIYEVDLLLFNEKYVIAVEVKSKLQKEFVEEHIDRLHKMIEQPPRLFNLKGKTLIGAIAAVSTEPDVIEFAIQSGLYLMVQRSNLIEIVNPPDFQPQEFLLE